MGVAERAPCADGISNSASSQLFLIESDGQGARGLQHTAETLDILGDDLCTLSKFPFSPAGWTQDGNGSVGVRCFRLGIVGRMKNGKVFVETIDHRAGPVSLSAFQLESVLGAKVWLHKEENKGPRVYHLIQERLPASILSSELLADGPATMGWERRSGRRIRTDRRRGLKVMGSDLAPSIGARGGGRRAI